MGEASPARLLAAAGGWLAACAAALRAEQDAVVQRALWRALAVLFERLGALAGAPGARREGAAIVGRLMPVALPLLQAPPSAPPPASQHDPPSLPCLLAALCEWLGARLACAAGAPPAWCGSRCCCCCIVVWCISARAARARHVLC